MLNAIPTFQNRNNVVTFGARKTKVPLHAQVLEDLDNLKNASQIMAENAGDGCNTGLSNVVFGTARELFAMAHEMTRQAIELLENNGTGTVKVPYGGKHQEREFKDGAMLRNDTKYPGVKAETQELGWFMQKLEYGGADNRLSAWTKLFQNGAGEKTKFGPGNERKTIERRADGTAASIDNVSQTGKTQVSVELDATGKRATKTEVFIRNTKSGTLKSLKVSPKSPEAHS